MPSPSQPQDYIPVSHIHIAYSCPTGWMNGGMDSWTDGWRDRGKPRTHNWNSSSCVITCHYCVSYSSLSLYVHAHQSVTHSPPCSVESCTPHSSQREARSGHTANTEVLLQEYVAMTTQSRHRSIANHCVSGCCGDEGKKTTSANHHLSRELKMASKKSKGNVRGCKGDVLLTSFVRISPFVLVILDSLADQSLYDNCVPWRQRVMVVMLQTLPPEEVGHDWT